MFSVCACMCVCMLIFLFFSLYQKWWIKLNIIRFRSISACSWRTVGGLSDRCGFESAGAHLLSSPRLPARRRRRRRYGCGLFNKTAITPDMVMYCAARRRAICSRTTSGLSIRRTYFNGVTWPAPATAMRRLHPRARSLSETGTCRTIDTALD